MFKIVLLVFVSLFAWAEDCKTCHNIEVFDEKNHNFDCIACHIEPNKRADYTHKDVVLHPDSLQNIDKFCISCHKEDNHGFKNSSHVTLKDEISLTKSLWAGKQIKQTLQSMPLPKQNITTLEELSDDFLRRKCLKCHIGNQSSGESGMNRGKGCMACHMEYSLDGKYKGSDLTIKDKAPYAKVHKLSAKPPMSACLSCHNKNYVGTDYKGLFPKDFDHAYKAPITKEGKYPKQTYGNSYHHLNEDIHYKAGLTCVDCHKKDEVMFDRAKASCKDCHKDISKNEAHDSYHDKVACSTCHSSWQISNYELSVFRDDTKDYKKWKNLINQEDAYLATFLKKAIKAKKEAKPYMPDWVTKKMHKGVWYSGYRFRRWEHLLLGNSIDGKIRVLRPLYQYRISYRDEKGEMVFDDVSKAGDKKIEAFTPYAPHTITKQARSCESCHENPLILNPKKDTNTVLDLFDGKVVKGSPLSKKQKQKLQSDKYKKIRAKMF